MPLLAAGVDVAIPTDSGFPDVFPRPFRTRKLPIP